jgi:PhnB protein
MGDHMSNSAPHGWRTVTPRIVTGDVAGLVGFLKAMFNATGEYRAGMPAEIMIGDSIVMIGDGGGRRETVPAFLYVYVKDANETRRCSIAGATPGRSRRTRHSKILMRRGERQ